MDINSIYSSEDQQIFGRFLNKLTLNLISRLNVFQEELVMSVEMQKRAVS